MMSRFKTIFYSLITIDDIPKHLKKYFPGKFDLRNCLPHIPQITEVACKILIGGKPTSLNPLNEEFSKIICEDIKNTKSYFEYIINNCPTTNDSRLITTLIQFYKDLPSDVRHGYWFQYMPLECPKEKKEQYEKKISKWVPKIKHLTFDSWMNRALKIANEKDEIHALGLYSQLHDDTQYIFDAITDAYGDLLEWEQE